MSSTSVPATSSKKYVLEVTVKPSWMDLYGVAIIKLILFLLFLFGYLNPWLYLVSTIVFIIVMAILSAGREKKLKTLVRERTNATVLDNFDDLSATYLNKDLLVAFYFFAGLVVSFFFLYDVAHVGHWTKHIFLVCLGILGGFVYCMVAIFGFIPYNAEPFGFKVKELIKQGDVTEEKDVSSDHGEELLAIRKGFDDSLEIELVDSNDLDIARLESELKNYTAKVDGYMLESVLIGALTFSGFLAIITTGYANSETFQQFTAEVGKMPVQFPGDLPIIGEKIKVLATTKNILALITVESLFCSVFYILILGLRMRFSNLSLNLDHLIRVMTLFNAKEEELINFELQGGHLDASLTKRKNSISHRISATISDAKNLAREIQPMVRLMTLYRNMGLLLFFIILVTSGLLFSVQVSFAIFGLAIVTWLYRNLEKITKLHKIRRILSRH